MRAKLLALMVFAFVPLRVEAEESKPTGSPVVPARSDVASAPLSAKELAEITGGEAAKIEVLTAQNLRATSTDNSISAESVTSGSVNFAENALNFNGIGNFVINTGNNNVLQGSLSVTIVNAPSP